MLKMAHILITVLSLGWLANAEESVVPVAGAPAINNVSLSIQSAPGGADNSKSQKANDSTQQKATVLSKEATQDVKKVSASILVDTSTTLASGAAGASGSAGNNYSQEGLYRLDVGVPLPGALTASFRGGYSQEYTYVNSDGSMGGFIDSRLGLSKGMGEIFKNLSLATTFNLILPTSRASQLAGLHSALGISLPLDYKTKRWDLGLAPSYTYYFFEFESQDDGSPNTAYSVAMPLSISYNFTDKLSFGVTLSLMRGWSYYNVPHDKFVSAYEVDYQFTKMFGGAIGIMTMASALKSNGLDYNYTLYDQNQAAGYIDAIISL